MKSIFLAFSLLLCFNIYAKNIACQADIKKFCSTSKGDKLKMKKCLIGHESELSSTCKEKISSIKKKMAEKNNSVKAKCEIEFKKYCLNKIDIKKTPIACLKTHRKVLSEKCKAAL